MATKEKSCAYTENHALDAQVLLEAVDAAGRILQLAVGSTADGVATLKMKANVGTKCPRQMLR